MGLVAFVGVSVVVSMVRVWGCAGKSRMKGRFTYTHLSSHCFWLIGSRSSESINVGWTTGVGATQAGGANGPVLQGLPVYRCLLANRRKGPQSCCVSTWANNR